MVIKGDAVQFAPSQQRSPLDDFKYSWDRITSYLSEKNGMCPSASCIRIAPLPLNALVS